MGSETRSACAAPPPQGSARWAQRWAISYPQPVTERSLNRGSTTSWVSTGAQHARAEAPKSAVTVVARQTQQDHAEPPSLLSSTSLSSFESDAVDPYPPYEAYISVSYAHGVHTESPSLQSETLADRQHSDSVERPSMTTKGSARGSHIARHLTDTNSSDILTFSIYDDPAGYIWRRYSSGTPALDEVDAPSQMLVEDSDQEPPGSAEEPEARARSVKDTSTRPPLDAGVSPQVLPRGSRRCSMDPLPEEEAHVSSRHPPASRNVVRHRPYAVEFTRQAEESLQPSTDSALPTSFTAGETQSTGLATQEPPPRSTEQDKFLVNGVPVNPAPEPPVSSASLQRRVSEDYPIPRWLLKKKYLTEAYRCPYRYNKTFSGKYGLINYNITGVPSDPIIFCFHGLNGNCLTFATFHTACPRYKYCVISFDLYGHGLSECPKYKPRINPFLCRFGRRPATYSLEFFVQQAEEVLSHVGVSEDRSDITLVGFSMGGVIAMGYAVHHPSRIARVLLISTAGLLRRRPLAVTLLKGCRCCIIPCSSKCVCSCCCQRRKFVQQFSKQDLESGLAEALWQRLIWQMFVKGGVVEAFLGCVAEVPLWSGEPIFRKAGSLGIPVLLLWAKDDTVAPLVERERLFQCLPNHHLIVFDQCTHLLLAERPQAVTALLLTFCEMPRESQLKDWHYILPFTPTGQYVPKDQRCPVGSTMEDYFEQIDYHPRVVLKLPKPKGSRTPS